MLPSMLRSDLCFTFFWERFWHHEHNDVQSGSRKSRFIGLGMDPTSWNQAVYPHLAHTGFTLDFFFILCPTLWKWWKAEWRKSAMWHTEIKCSGGLRINNTPNDIKLFISLKCSAIDLCMKRSVYQAGDIKWHNLRALFTPTSATSRQGCLSVDRCPLTFANDLRFIVLVCGWFLMHLTNICAWCWCLMDRVGNAVAFPQTAQAADSVNFTKVHFVC